MHISPGPDELSHLKPGLLGDHMSQQRIAGDVEGQSQESIHGTHGQHAGQLAVRDIELKYKMAGRQLHLLYFTHIPGADDMTAGIRVVFNRIDYSSNLVNMAPIRTLPRPPLRTIDGSKLAILVGPLIPDRNSVFF
ncbi:hypothetical protein D3C75_770460 [compost metagenome]